MSNPASAIALETYQGTVDDLTVKAAPERAEAASQNTD